jgi:peptidyl-prolyl cis-trans isomerase C
MDQAYLELKLSWELFHKAPETLSPPERNRIGDVAAKQERIEQRILSSELARDVMIPEPTLRTRIAEIRQRYPDEDAYRQDIARIGLDELSLAASVERDLRVEAVLDRVVSAVPPVSPVDAEIYYRLHPDAFDRPEARRLRHILITVDSPQQADQAHRLLDGLRTTHASPEKFAQAALRHSQCPSALEGGMLGVVRRHQLFPELESAAFALGEGEISEVLASEMGLHIIRCDEILPCGMVPFAEARERIIDRLTEKRRQETQKQWIKQLMSARQLA